MWPGRSAAGVRQSRLRTVPRLWAATGDAVVRIDDVGSEWMVTRVLDAAGAQCVAADAAAPDVVYVGLREGGVRRTRDGGSAWEDCALPEAGVFSLAVSAADGAVYAGTEPSRLFRSDDGGDTWDALDALLDVPSRPSWRFPPRPWTSHVRWIAPSPHDADLLLVGIELGGLMRSTDRGRSWQDHRPGAQRDVHALAWHPRVPGRAYEAGGGGVAYSEDAGESWLAADEGMDRHYAWAVAVDPDVPERWFVSASTGPFAAHGAGDPEAALYRRQGGGWQRVDGGLPDPLTAMPYALVAVSGRVVAGLRDGQLWESGDGGERWSRSVVRGEQLAGVQALAAA